MRLIHPALAFVTLTASMFASMADARAQFGSSSNYVMGNLPNNKNVCPAFAGAVDVTLTVTQDIVVASSTCPNGGFGMQLNANGPAPATSLSSTQLLWQQFIINATNQGVTGFTQQFSNNAGDTDPPIEGANGSPANSIPLGSPSTLGENFLRVAAGTTFTWTLTMDSNNNVEQVKYGARDSMNTPYTSVVEVIPAGDRAPIVSFQLDIVGWTNGCFTTFASGAGTITYSTPKTKFIPMNNVQNCAVISAFGLTFTTGESSNSVYGPMSGGESTLFSQKFQWTSVGTFVNGDFGYPANSPPALGDWAVGDYKGECALGQPIIGVSRIPGELWSEAVECGLSQAAYSNSESGCNVRQVENQDNRGDTDGGTDWDPGNYKTECKANEYVAGVSQYSGNGTLTNILCCPASVGHNSCEAQVFYNGDSPAYKAPDWNVGFYKGQCPPGQYVSGISTPAFASVGSDGAAHAILCCSP
jgi:hypothetical protein